MATDPTTCSSKAGERHQRKGRGERRERRDDRETVKKSPYIERVVFINRVSKVV
jgi:small subunit ribosomal protein S5